LIHRGIIEKLGKYKRLREYTGTDDEINKICDLKKEIFSYYQEMCGVLGGKDEYKPSDVLVSKIILGTLGCVPAYDRYFIDGLRIRRIKPLSFGKKNLQELKKFFDANSKEFQYVQDRINKESGVLYPDMKLLDMYFWQLGFRGQI